MTFSQPFPQDSGQNQPGKSAGGVLTPPKFVNYAFYLFLLVALTRVIGIIITLATIPAQTDAAKKAAAGQGGSALSSSQIDAVVQASVIIAIVVGVLFLVAFVVFDVLMRRGFGWTRWVLGAITLVSLTGVASAYGVGALGVVAGVVATILMFLRPSSDYFRAVRDRKRGALGGGYPGPDQPYPGPSQTPPPAQ